jgi:hypothetical protein
MKHVLIVAIWLSSIAVSLPPGGKTEQRPTGINTPAQNKNPSTVAPPVSAQQSTANQDTRDNQSPHGYTSPESVLAIVATITMGFIGWQAWETRRAAKAAACSVKAIVSQGRILERQTKATEDAAKAARDSAEAIINSERAWVLVEIQRIPNLGLAEQTINGVESLALKVDLICKNDGNTPCWITEIRVRFEIVDAPPHEPRLEPEDIVDIGPVPLGVGQPPWKITVERACKGRPRLGKMMILYGIVKYRDVFKPDRHTGFGYNVSEQGAIYRIPELREYQYNAYS